MSGTAEGHVFISYVREDSADVDRIEATSKVRESEFGATRGSVAGRGLEDEGFDKVFFGAARPERHR